MAQIELKNAGYAYPDESQCAICDVNLNIDAGEFVLLCGETGSGKSTLLRLMKKGLCEAGTQYGSVLYEGVEVKNLPDRRAVCEIGYVFQDSDSQIVMDTVWHELAFSLENLALSQDAMRARIAEMATFFGISDLMEHKVHTLSGGEKKTLCLASVLVLRPRVLLLDEPIASLDPLAAQKFVELLGRIHRELGITIIVAEHCMEELLPHITRMVYLDEGHMLCCGSADEVLMALNDHAPSLLPQMPKLYFNTGSSGTVFKSPYDAQKSLQNFNFTVKTRESYIGKEQIFCIKEVEFFYPGALRATLSGVSLSIEKGECLAILGGNGAGKSTLLKLMARIIKLTRGKIKLHGKGIKTFSDEQFYGMVGYLAQNPRLYFTKETVGEQLNGVSETFGLSALSHKNPSELSGGQQELLALATVLRSNTDIFLLDEPTSSLDAQSKEYLARIFSQLREKGKTIVFITHDMEFAASVATRCVMLFDGQITACDTPDKFFSEQYFYTTPLRRALRENAKGALLVEDLLCEK